MNDSDKKPLFKVMTCATCANLGPGYDIAALALDMYNECEVYAGEGSKHSIEFNGPHAGDIKDNGSLVMNAFASVLAKKKDLPCYLDIKMTVNIPVGKGLGSSASAVLSGLLIANKAYELGMNKKQLLEAAMEFEESPDNIAAALTGSIAIVYRSGAQYLFEKISLPDDYHILLFIPPDTADTKKARKLIPQEIPISDASENISGFSLLLKYLEEGDPGGAAAFTRDHMYQKYRKAMYPASLKLAEELINTHGIPAFISGAGPSVAAILDNGMLSRFKDIRGRISAEYLSFQSMITGISRKGSHYI